jgi:LacI family transcriptional regulator
MEKNLLITDLSEKDCIAAAKKILAMKPMPDGIFVTNDFSAAVIMRTLQDEGIRIPEDIAIVGFNNDTISTLIQPTLTTINYPGAEIGEIVAQNLIQHLQGKSDLSLTNTIIINSALIIRASSSRKNKL